MGLGFFLFIPLVLSMLGIKPESSANEKLPEEKPALKTEQIKNDPDTLFSALKVLEIDGKVVQLETTKSFLLVSIKSIFDEQTTILAYRYDGELIWEKKFDSKNPRVAVSKYSDVIVIKEPIVKEDPYDTSLRDCKYSVFDKSGKELSTFQNPCYSVFPMGNYGYLVINSEGPHANMSIYDFRSNEFYDYVEPIHYSTPIDTNRLITFDWEQELKNPQAVDSLQNVYNENRKEIYNRRAELRELTTAENRDSVNSLINQLKDQDRNIRKETTEQINKVSQRRITSLKMVDLTLRDGKVFRKSTPLQKTSEELNFGIRLNIRQIAYEPGSGSIGFVANFLMQENPVQLSERKILFLNDDGSVLNTLSIPGSIQQFEFVNESTVLVLTGTSSKLPTDYSLLLYDFRKSQVIWKKDNIPFGAHEFSLLFPGDNSDTVIIHTKIAPENPCKTDILVLEIESAELRCPMVFDNHEMLYHPSLIQNPANLKEFALLNAKENKVIFAVSNR
ncbi:hypothetical protein [Gracilimonas tropica]|uniref:hypothetical protein n=1 Tax=Gracilimonas tropica TaxID=454600 RepID=UPI0012F77BA6|nr:hypothetical protein [Gracilimonas tropica]